MLNSFAIPSQVRAVLFDAVGTLIHPEPPVAPAYRKVGCHFGSCLDEDEILVRFRQAFARQEALDADNALDASEERERARWRAIVSEVFDDVTEKAGLFAALWEHFAVPAHWRLFDDAAPAWLNLSQRGLRLGIASNFDLRLERLAAAMPPLDQAAAVYASTRVGYRKPAREFFQTIERALELNPEELLLVGDDQANDFNAARAAGWHAVLVVRDQQKPPGVGLSVQSLMELC
ncbi:MAG: HAD-IA family hydrolase [Pirellulales bacterium]